MHTSVRRSVPATLVAGALLGVAGLPSADVRHLVPGVLVLLLAGGTAGISLHLWRVRRTARARGVPGAQPSAPVAPWPSLVPTQRARRTAGAPRPVPQHPSGASSGSAVVDGWPPSPPGGSPHAEERPRVLPHGALPLQRRPSAGS